MSDIPAGVGPPQREDRPAGNRAAENVLSVGSNDHNNSHPTRERYPFAGTPTGDVIARINRSDPGSLISSDLYPDFSFDGFCPICDRFTLTITFDPDRPLAVFLHCRPQLAERVDDSRRLLRTLITGCGRPAIYSALHADQASQKYLDGQTDNPVDAYWSEHNLEGIAA